VDFDASHHQRDEGRSKSVTWRLTGTRPPRYVAPLAPPNRFLRRSNPHWAP